MKRNVQKALAISGLAITIGVSGLTLPASANTNGAKNIQGSKHERILRTKIERKDKTMVSRRVTPGVVQAIDTNSMKITHGSKTYTVNFDSSTRLLDHKWNPIETTQLKTGDKVRVLGTISEQTITAKTIRDISL